MNTVLWVIQVLLAFAFFAAGLLKVVRAKEQVAAQFKWARNAAPGTIKLIGLIEVLGAVGLLAPAATGIFPILTPLAAIGLAWVMVGAIIVHQRVGDPPTQALPAVVLGLLAGIVVYGRIVMVPFVR